MLDLILLTIVKICGVLVICGITSILLLFCYFVMKKFKKVV